MADITPIIENRTIIVTGWTVEQFMEYVKYEARFVGELTDARDTFGVAAAYRARYQGTHHGTGYNGLPVTIRTTLCLL